MGNWDEKQGMKHFRKKELTCGGHGRKEQGSFEKRKGEHSTMRG